MKLPKHYARLSAMMFFQFGIYGLWLPIAGRFLTADPESEGGLGFSDAVLLNGFLASRFAIEGRTLGLAEFRPFWYALGAITLAGLAVFLLRFRVEEGDAVNREP